MMVAMGERRSDCTGRKVPNSVMDRVNAIEVFKSPIVGERLDSTSFWKYLTTVIVSSRSDGGSLSNDSVYMYMWV